MMCHNLMLHFAFVIELALKVRARDVYYITSAFTECFPVASASDILPSASKQPADPTTTLMAEPPEVAPFNPIYPPSPPADSNNLDVSQPPGVVAYSMPPCAVCDCPTCTITSVFETALPDFDSNGPTERPYTITETYVGMSSLPYFPTPTPVPYGFTTAVETCTNCGAQAIIGTIVTPKTGGPRGQDIPGSAMEGPRIQPCGAPRPQSRADSPVGATTASTDVGAVETTFIVSTERTPETTQTVGLDMETWGGNTSIWGPSAASPSYVHVSAAKSSVREDLLSYIVVMSTFLVIVLFR